MSLALSEEQELLRNTAREFVTEHAPVKELRKLRDSNDPVGFSRDLWKQMAELGWAGIVLPEEFGGADLGYAELGIVLEECGRTLVATPFVSTLLLGANVLLLARNGTQQKEVLASVCKGETILALALQESAHHAPYQVATRAEATRDGYKLTGTKTFVQDGHVADQIVVVARSAGKPGERDGITLFLVPKNARGLKVTRTIMVDGRNSAQLALDGVEVDKSAVVGQLGRGADLLDPVLDRATIGLCAEMLGTIGEAFDRTVSYLKTRKQFGVPIGSFQALKHRAATMFTEVELSRSIVLEALRAIDEKRPDVPQLASIAKARLSDTAFLVGNEAVQMFGGIGVTDEEEIGLFLKRARVAELSFGDAAYHRARFATLSGF
ncbi:MAG TPA: acyl-CoA dehydrogenase [Myxococcota bacterium]|nr:acyl-CoA dehydrogenase [Myxococcota bacterium]